MDGQINNACILELLFHPVQCVYMYMYACIIPIHPWTIMDGQRNNVILDYFRPCSVCVHVHVCMRHSHPSMDNPWMVRDSWITFPPCSESMCTCMQSSLPSMDSTWMVKYTMYSRITLFMCIHVHVCMRDSLPPMDNPWVVRETFPPCSVWIHVHVCMCHSHPSMDNPWMFMQRYNVFLDYFSTQFRVYMHAAFPSIHGQYVDGQRYNVFLDYFSTLFSMYTCTCMHASFPSIHGQSMDGHRYLTWISLPPCSV